MTDEAQIRLKAVYFDQTVRALREMITNERKWAETQAADVVSVLIGDVTYPYATGRTAELTQRAVRLSTLHDILNLMTRNVERPAE